MSKLQLTLVTRFLELVAISRCYGAKIPHLLIKFN